jgi:hypothetical protein
VSSASKAILTMSRCRSLGRFQLEKRSGLLADEVALRSQGLISCSSAPSPYALIISAARQSSISHHLTRLPTRRRTIPFSVYSRACPCWQASGLATLREISTYSETDLRVYLARPMRMEAKKTTYITPRLQNNQCLIGRIYLLDML